MAIGGSAEQHWALEGCCNFRDLGGYATPTGARLRARQLFRADSLTTATESDRCVLAGLGLATVLDLRSEAEVELAGRYEGAGSDHYHVPLGNPMHGMAPGDWDVPDRVAARYMELLLAGSESVAEVLAILTDPGSYPAVVHCSIGKDRTGVMIAVVLAVLGVGDDEIVADYALSGMGAARMALRLREQFAEQPTDLEPFLPALLSAHPETMRAFLELMRTKFGTVEGYIEEIGLGSAVGYLRDALLER